MATGTTWGLSGERGMRGGGEGGGEMKEGEMAKREREKWVLRVGGLLDERSVGRGEGRAGRLKGERHSDKLRASWYHRAASLCRSISLPQGP